MTERAARGSGPRWGPLFDARATEWAQTWEGPDGWGTAVYGHVLDRARIGAGTRVLDCGCGAGRFARMAADRDADVAGIDAARGLVEIAAGCSPGGDFRVGDLEDLPWPDDSFDVVTGFSAFQFAQDKVRALAEARRVSRGSVVVVVPHRPGSGVAAVFEALRPLFPPPALAELADNGIFALSEPGRLDDVCAAAGLAFQGDEEIEAVVHFADPDIAVRAFTAAGPTRLATMHAGEVAVAHAVRDALQEFTGPDRQVDLPGWFRVVTARGSGRAEPGPATPG
jgi:SAM-dependent methyltransferase